MLTIYEMALVVYLRFGTLDNDNRRWHTPREVLEMTGIKIVTQRTVIRRWRMRGFRVENRHMLAGR